MAARLRSLPRLPRRHPIHANSTCRRAGRYGKSAAHFLVAGLGSPRESLASAARGVLLDEFGHWSSFDSAQARARLAILAESLTASMPQYDRPTRRFAADLALRIVHSPHSDADRDRGAL